MPLEPAIKYISDVFKNPQKWVTGQNTNSSNILITPTKLTNINESVKDKIKQSIEFFKSKGYSKYVIAGLLGNFKTESEFSNKNISKIASDPENKANNIGIAQWQGDRFKELKLKYPTNYNTLQAQLEFVDYELKNKVFTGRDPKLDGKIHKWVYNNIKDKTDITEITHEISVYYEGSSFKPEYQKAQQSRINNALEIYNKFL